MFREMKKYRYIKNVSYLFLYRSKNGPILTCLVKTLFWHKPHNVNFY